MSDPFLGEIQLYGFNFAPNNWAFCAGQLMPISQNTALFSLLGAVYGGNGVSTFGLPNLQGQAVCATGQGSGLTQRALGESFGSETVSLLQSEMPMHSHVGQIFSQHDANKRTGTPAAGDALTVPSTSVFTTTAAANGSFAPPMLGPDGGGQPHPNQQPYLAVNFCIALQGTFPQRP